MGAQQATIDRKYERLRVGWLEAVSQRLQDTACFGTQRCHAIRHSLRKYPLDINEHNYPITKRTPT